MDASTNPGSTEIPMIAMLPTSLATTVAETSAFRPTYDDNGSPHLTSSAPQNGEPTVEVSAAASPVAGRGLTKATLGALGSDNRARRKHIKEDRWIGYPSVKAIYSCMEATLDDEPVERVPHILIVASSNNGKTRLLNKFAKDFPRVSQVDQEADRLPVVKIEAPDGPDENQFFDDLIDALIPPETKRLRLTRVSDKKSHAVALARAQGVRMILIDEAHSILAGSAKAQHKFMVTVKRLGNVLRATIVCAGTKNVLMAVTQDDQLENRFQPFTLPRWSDTQEYRQLLNSFERFLPLHHPSYLADDAIALPLMKHSEGLIGEMAKIIRLSALDALGSTERITPSHIERLLETKAYVPPSRRRAEAQIED